jgi:hypothetical protein
MAYRPTRRFVLAGAASSSFAAPFAARAAAPFSARYALYVGGLKGAEAALNVRREGGRYAAAATVRAAGLVNWLFDLEVEAAAEGTLAGVAPAPERFDAEARFGADRYALAMAFDPVPSVTAEPPLRERSYDARPEALAGALDPLSAAVAACLPVPEAEAGDRTVAIYDARRRVDVRIGPARAEGARLKAEAELVRVAGFKAKHLSRPPFPMTLWWDLRDGVAELARAQGATPFGAAVVTRRG